MPDRSGLVTHRAQDGREPRGGARYGPPPVALAEQNPASHQGQLRTQKNITRRYSKRMEPRSSLEVLTQSRLRIGLTYGNYI